MSEEEHAAPEPVAEEGGPSLPHSDPVEPPLGASPPAAELGARPSSSSLDEDMFVDLREDYSHSEGSSSDEEFHDSVDELQGARFRGVAELPQQVFHDMSTPETPPLDGLDADTPEPGDQPSGSDYSSMDEEEQHFDITLAASHSYLGSGLVRVGGRALLEAGWRGAVPVLSHSGPVFPGETVPLRLTRAHDVAELQRALQGNKLFGLLSPDETWMRSSGYGSLCEVYEASEPAPEGGEVAVNVLARATHRFKVTARDRTAESIRLYDSVRVCEVEVLPERCLRDPLYPPRLASLDHLRNSRTRCVRDVESTMWPWPRFVFEMTDVARIRRTIQSFFKTMDENMPEEPISLSFWVASNLPLNKRDRLSLLKVDEALLRLTMEAEIIARNSTLHCCSCMSAITRLEHIFAMSSEGVHSNYTNRYGFLHDVVTTSHVTNVTDGGTPSTEYSWFPGYSWTIVLCASCNSHVGWRFDALRRNLRPLRFYGICRNYVEPIYRDGERTHSRNDMTLLQFIRS